MAHAHTLNRTALLLSPRRADTIRTWSTQVSFPITPRMISAQDTWNWGSLVSLYSYSPNRWLRSFMITCFGIWYEAMKCHVISLQHLLRCSYPLPSPPLSPSPPSSDLFRNEQNVTLHYDYKHKSCPNETFKTPVQSPSSLYSVIRFPLSFGGT